MSSRIFTCIRPAVREIGARNISTSTSMKIKTNTERFQLNKNQESARMQAFHEKLNANRLPRVDHGMRLVDVVLFETDPKTGELIPDTEKEPTKWGDWQQGGRVTDF